MVFIRRTEPTKPNQAYMTAAARDKLVVDKQGCLRLEKGGELPVWPHAYALVVRSGELTILDGDGEAVARVGDVVSMGGGQVTAQDGPPGKSKQVFEKRRRELGIPDRCRGILWMVGPPVRVVGGEKTG